MPKEIFQKWMPSKEYLEQHQSLKMLGNWIFDENLWHLTRHSSAMAVFIGLFVAFMPTLGQMFIAAFLALFFRANLPVSVGLVWITNPLTMVPLFYGTYSLGSFLLGQDASFIMEVSIETITNNVAIIWKPLLLGSITCGFFFGSLGYALTRLSWRLMVVRKWQKRNRKRG